MNTDGPLNGLTSLCDNCRTIPFREIQENPQKKFKTVKIGTYKELKQRLSCPFCCLVFESICDLARQWALSRHVEYSGPDQFIEEAWPYDIDVDWRRYYFDTSVTNTELRFTTGPCPRLGCVVTPTSVKVDALTSLLQHCDAAHECSLSVSPEDFCQYTTLRAIDVHQMCVTPIVPGTRYVALSYVWGGVTLSRLVTSNMAQLTKPYALETYKRGLPLTIRDAIKLVRKMDIRYLWVDALCLVQDDQEDLNKGIKIMSAIYEHAYFTIVAADGLNADAGLPGVSSREANQIVGEILPGVQLVGVRKADLMLDEMHYSHRAWTFQEFHISRRKLIFLEGIMYYQCMESFWGEDRDEQPIYPEFKTLMQRVTKPGEKIREYTNLLSRYTTRQSSYPYDVVNAMISVYHKVLGKSHGGHLFCIPVVAFDWFMCFYAYEGDWEQYVKRREKLPSWAWPGWKGRLLWTEPFGDKEIAAWAARSTWIVWYVRDRAGTPIVIWSAAENDGNEARALTERVLAERAANKQKFSAGTLPILPSRESPRAYEFPNSLLQFWSFSASFNLRVDKKAEQYLKGLDFGNWRTSLSVFDRNDNYTGFIYIDEEDSKRDHDDAEIIAISEAHSVIRPEYSFIYTSSKDMISNKNTANGCWYNVLYVVERSGVVERKGFGQVYSDEIQVSPDSPWEWKEFILG